MSMRYRDVRSAQSQPGILSLGGLFGSPDGIAIYALNLRLGSAPRVRILDLQVECEMGQRVGSRVIVRVVVAAGRV